MGFIKVALNDVSEPKAAPEGEYDLTIISAEDKESKKGAQMTEVKIRIDNQESFPIRHFLVYPDENTPPDQVNMRLLDIKRFLACFGIPFEDGFDTEDLPGATGRSLVVQEEGDDGNVYNRLRLPRLKE